MSGFVPGKCCRGKRARYQPSHPSLNYKCQTLYQHLELTVARSSAAHVRAVGEARPFRIPSLHKSIPPSQSGKTADWGRACCLCWLPLPASRKSEKCGVGLGNHRKWSIVHQVIYRGNLFQPTLKRSHTTGTYCSLVQCRPIYYYTTLLPNVIVSFLKLSPLYRFSVLVPPEAS